MAALIGYLKGCRQQVSRTGSKHSGISARLQTWAGQLTVRLEADGGFTLTSSEIGGGMPKVVCMGNVDDQEFFHSGACKLKKEKNPAGY